MNYKNDTINSYGELKDPTHSVIAEISIDNENEHNNSGKETFTMMFDKRQMELIVTVGDIDLDNKYETKENEKGVKKFLSSIFKGYENNKLGTISFGTKEDISGFLFSIETFCSNIRQIINSQDN